MLDIFRNKGFSSVLYGILILGLGLTFATQWGPGMGRGKTKGWKEAFNEVCVVRVGGACVPAEEHRAVYTLAGNLMGNGTIDSKRMRQMKVGKTVTDGLIERELLAAQAERVGLTVTEEEVAQATLDGFVYLSGPTDAEYLAYSMPFMTQGKVFLGFQDRKKKEFSERAFKEQVKMYTRLGPNQFKAWQGREILASKMRDLVRAPVRVGDDEAQSEYVRRNSTASLGYVEVPKAFVTRYVKEPIAAELEAWAKVEANGKAIEAAVEEDKKAFAPKAGVIRHILVKVAPGAKQDAQDLAALKLGAAAARLAAGEGFASVAKRFSEDSSKDSGGSVGDKTDGFVKPFKDAADALKPGQVTDGAIESQFGYHIIAKDDPAVSLNDAKLKLDATRRLYVAAKTVELGRQIASKVQSELGGGKPGDEAVRLAIASFDTTATGAFAPVKVKRDPASGAATPVSDAGAPDASPAKASKPEEIKAPRYSMVTDPEKLHFESSNSFNRGGDPIAALSGMDGAKVSQFAFKAKDNEVMPDVVTTEQSLFVVRAKERKIATKEEFEKERDVFVQAMLAQKRAEVLASYMRRLREDQKPNIKVFDENSAEGKGDAGPIALPDEEE
jgi:peptidyl-prolyl cis-trans isomerase D